MRKFLTILLSVVILVTSVSVGFVASAAETNANVESVTEYDTTSSPTLSSVNRLSGIPYVYASGSTSGAYKEKCDANSASSTFLYDGTLSHGWSNPTRNGYRYYNGLNADGSGAPTGTASSKIVLELGKVYAVDELLVAGSSNQNPITSFEIYLGDDFDTLFTDDNKVVAYTRTANSTKHIYHIKLKEAVSAAYYGIKFLAVDKDTKVVNDKSIYLNELGAYGSNTTVVENNSTVNSTSIIYGATPVNVQNNSNQTPSSFRDNSKTDGGSLYTVLTNGKVTDNVYNARIWNMPSLSSNYYGGGKITYNLYNSYNVSKVLLVSGDTSYTYVSKWKVYAADTLEDLYKAHSLRAVVENNSGSGRVIDAAKFDTPIKCKYVGIQIVANKDTAQTSAYIGEIGIYGTDAFTNEANLEITTMPGDNVINKASTESTVSTYAKQGLQNDTNLADRTTSGCHGSTGPVNVLYDNSLTNTNRIFRHAVTADGYGFHNMAVVFVTGKEYNVNAAMVSVAGKENAVSYVVYVGDSKDTLFCPENILAVCDNPNKLYNTYVSVPADKAKTGKAFGILITGFADVEFMVDEIAFFEPNAAYGENVTSSGGVNLLDGNTMKFYKYSVGAETFTEKPKDENNQNINKLTNGSFTDESNKNTFRTTGLRFYSATETAWVFDAGKTVDISKILFASGVSLEENNDTAFGAYSVYVGDTLDSTLFDAKNKVAYYANCDFSQIQSFDLSQANVSGRYVAIRIHDIYTHYTSSGLTSNTADSSFYITEFAVYGNYATDAYTVVNEPNKEDLATNELEFATLSTASDDANGILTDGTVYYTGADTSAALTFEDADAKTFTYDLDANLSINSFLIGSKYDSAINLTPAHYKIYVADTLEGLDTATAIVDYYPANYAPDSGTYQGSVQQFVLKDAVQGRFVRFEFTKAALANGDLNLTELGVYTNAEAVINLTGSITAPVAVYTDGETAEFTTESNQLKLDSAMARGQHSVVVVDASGNTEVYFLNKGSATKQDALANAFTNKSADFADITPYGIDFVVDITDAAKAEADEIGIVVAKKATLNGKDLIADAESYKNAKAVVYDGTENNLEGNSFSATVHNFEQYKYLYRYAARAYMIVEGYVVYGVPFDTTPAEAAKRVVDNASGYSAELVAYAQNIVNNSGISEVALARADFLRLESTKTDGLDAAATIQNSVACNTNTNLARLKAVIEKAQRGEDIVLATLGGSITQGFNANYNPATAKSEFDRSTHCWSNLLREWLQNTFDVNVTLYNAGIGSTTSTVGVGRVVNDVLSHNPDLVVIDYAVNDSDSTSDASLTMTYAYEALTRRILSSGDDVALMMMFAAKQDLSNKQEKYAAIGNHYGIPMISYRDAIKPLITDGTYAWSDFSNDTIHPHAYGHQVIAALFGHYIAGVIDNIDNITDTVTALPDYWDSETAADVKSLETATLYHSDTLPAEWVESYGSFEISHNIHAQFPNGWLVDYAKDSGNEPMVINVPNAKKLIFLIHNKGNGTTGTYGNANLTFVGPDGTTTKQLLTYANGDYANEIIRYDATTSGEVKVTITPETNSTTPQFKLLGIIVTE